MLRRSIEDIFLNFDTDGASILDGVPQDLPDVEIMDRSDLAPPSIWFANLPARIHTTESVNRSNSSECAKSLACLKMHSCAVVRVVSTTCCTPDARDKGSFNHLGQHLSNENDDKRRSRHNGDALVTFLTTSTGLNLAENRVVKALFPINS